MKGVNGSFFRGKGCGVMGEVLGDLDPLGVAVSAAHLCEVHHVPVRPAFSFRISIFGFRVSSVECRVSGFEFRVSSFGVSR